VDHPQIRGLSEWRPLARGGFAVVWQARQLSLDRMVAVKVYERELDEGHRRRFLREAAAARLSDHPGVVTVHDAGVLPDDRPYLIMDLWSGGSLSQWLKPDNRPSQERVRQVGVRIADALAAIHGCGVLHRDVKPANILIDSFGNPGLADFGLATIAGAVTRAADVLYVTPAYARQRRSELRRS
jgi:serine/threonine protein kinase